METNTQPNPEETIVYPPSQETPIDPGPALPKAFDESTMDKKGFPAGLAAFIVTVIIMLVGGLGGYYYLQQNNPELLASFFNKGASLTGQSTKTTPTPTTQATPTPMPEVIAFDFDDSTVSLDPKLQWKELSATETTLGESVLLVSGPGVDSPKITVSGKEWVATYDPDKVASASAETVDNTARLQELGWQTDGLGYKGFIFNALTTSETKADRRSYIRSKDGKIQVYVESSKTLPNGDIELRRFLSDALDMVSILNGITPGK